MTPLIRTAVAVSVFALAGCGNGTIDVSGKVTFNGKPVVYGTVVVVGGDGIPKAGTIRPDGSFQLTGVTTGFVKITVSSPKPPGNEPPPKKQDPDDDKILPPPPSPAPPEVIKNWVALPEKYGNPDKSALTATIKAGEVLEIELK